jgi:hypothetical protein
MEGFRASLAFLWERAALISSTCRVLVVGDGARGWRRCDGWKVCGGDQAIAARLQVRCAARLTQKRELTLSQAAAHSPLAPPSHASSASLMASWTSLSWGLVVIVKGLRLRRRPERMDGSGVCLLDPG